MTSLRFLILIGLALLNTADICAQRFSLYNSHTLTDALENPYQHVFFKSEESQEKFGYKGKSDIKKMKKFQMNFLTFNVSHNLVGPKTLDLSNFLFNEDMDYDISRFQPSTDMNFFNQNIDFNLFTMRFMIHKASLMEFTYAVQMKAENQISFSNNLVNALFQGTGAYPGIDLNGMFNTEAYSTSYFKITYGLRRNINEKFAVGINYHRYLGLHDVRNTISTSNFYTDPSKEKNYAYMEGQYSSFFNYKDSTYQKKFKEYWDVPTGDGFFAGITGAVSSSLKTMILNNILKSGGRGVSIGASYQHNDKLFASLAVKDWANMHWSEKSVSYNYIVDSTYTGLFNIRYDTSFQLLPVLDTAMIYLKGDKAKTWRYVDSLIFAQATDTMEGTYKTHMPLAFELGVSYRWLDWYSTAILIHKFHRRDNIQFTILNRFKAWRSLFFNLNVGFGTERHTVMGAQLMLRSNAIDYYIGSEQLMNWFIPVVQFGADINMGFAVRF